MATESITLFELCSGIRKALNTSLPDAVWVVAEISEIRSNYNGHCYLELIQKDENSDQILARMRATIWSYTYKLLKPYFESSTGQTLTPGLKILIRGTVEYQEVYGISLNIRDIDPTYTIGDIARRRMQIIEQLRAEGVLEMNKELDLPMVIQRIAIISSAQAAGFEDFVKQLTSHPDQFHFVYHLYPSVMQGDNAEESIIESLEKIFEEADQFDAVVLVRGGGATADLICFDSYNIALNISQFPLPVLTGIGHERDLSVADMVAYQHFKTPTAVAEFIIQHNLEFEDLLNQYQERVMDLFSDHLENQKRRLLILASQLAPVSQQHVEKHFRHLNRLHDKVELECHRYVENKDLLITRSTESLHWLTHKLLLTESHKIKSFHNLLKGYSIRYIGDKKTNLHLHEATLRLNDPVNILSRGYSITYHQGKVVKSIQDLQSGNAIKTRLKDGEIRSIVE